MKSKFKFWGIILISLCLFGCSFNNSPKSKVESVLMKYQNNTDIVSSELSDYLSSLNVNEKDYDDYKKVYERQYNDLTYEIKDETIDGDSAIVTVQVEVYDYYKVENDITKYTSSNPDEFMTNNVYDLSKVLEYKLDKLFKTDERVTYTIAFSLTKIDNEWTIDKLSNEDLEKIHGVYAH